MGRVDDGDGGVGSDGELVNISDVSMGGVLLFAADAKASKHLLKTATQ